jgi:hypothetical protein
MPSVFIVLPVLALDHMLEDEQCQEEWELHVYYRFRRRCGQITVGKFKNGVLRGTFVWFRPQWRGSNPVQNVR